MKRWSKLSVKVLSLMMSLFMMLGIVLFMDGEKVEAGTYYDKFGRLSAPKDIEFDNQGNMYVANFYSINKITPDGEVTVIPSDGIYGPLNRVSDIEFDSYGNMYISNYYGPYSSTINKITPEGVITTIGSGGIYYNFYQITNIEFDSEDNLYIADEYWNFVSKITPAGKVTVIRDGGEYGNFNGVSDIKFDNEGNTWICHENGFNVIEPNGNVYEYDYGSYVNDLEFDDEGNIIFVSALHGVVKITDEGIITISNNGVYGHLTGARALEFDSKGTMYLLPGWDYVTEIIDYSGTYNIVSKKSNLLMDVYNGGKEQGVNVIQWPENGGQNQQWKFELQDNGFYKITSVLSGLSLDVYNAGLSEGNRVIQWPYHGGANQQWQLWENSDGTICFKSRLSFEKYNNYVLDVYSGGVAPGVNVIQWSSNNGDNQKWYLQPVEEHSVKFESNGGSTIDDKSHLPGVPIEEPTYPTKENLVFGGWYKDEALTKKWNFAKDKMPSENITLYAKWEQDYSGVYIIKSKNSDLVMDVYGGGIDQGVNIIQWPQHGRSNQQWKLESLGNGYYKISSMLSGMSIDVFGGGTTLGNRVIQWPYHGGTNQQWKIIKNNDDTISLMSRLAEDSETGYILDVFGGGKDQGVNVIQWTGHYGNNQKWILENIGK